MAAVNFEIKEYQEASLGGVSRLPETSRDARWDSGQGFLARGKSRWL